MNQRSNTKDLDIKLLRQCLGCKAIEYSDAVFPEGQIDQDWLKQSGYDFSHGYISLECFAKDYDDGSALGNRVIQNAESVVSYRFCPKYE